MRLYVGNLSWGTSEENLRDTFAAFGTVDSFVIIKDRATGKSRGFGFVEMPNRNEGQAAIDALHGQDLDGRDLTVNEAKPREERRGGGGDRGGDRGGYRGGGGRY